MGTAAGTFSSFSSLVKPASRPEMVVAAARAAGSACVIAQSTFAPDSFTASAHFSISLWM